MMYPRILDLPESYNHASNDSSDGDHMDEELEGAWDAISHVLVALGLVVMVENALVLIAFVFHKQLRVLSNTFVVSLSIADFMYALYSTMGTSLLGSPSVYRLLFSHNDSQDLLFPLLDI